MRTTVTLDPDVAARLKALARQRGTSFKEVLNSALRRGLSEESPWQRPFEQQTFTMGVRPGIDLTKALRLAAELEDDEIVRKLELRK